MSKEKGTRAAIGGTFDYAPFEKKRQQAPEFTLPQRQARIIPLEHLLGLYNLTNLVFTTVLAMRQPDVGKPILTLTAAKNERRHLSSKKEKAYKRFKQGLGKHKQKNSKPISKWQNRLCGWTWQRLSRRLSRKAVGVV